MNCEDCKHRIGDGHPYGNITCRINGRYRHMGRECDTGEYAPIVSDKEIITQLQAEANLLKQRLEAAEKVCGAAVRYCNPDDDDVCYIDFLEIVERWQQEVRQCADQQQKKS